MSKQALEETIKEYFDQYGAILVGMHQDLQSQQATVDRKLADVDERSAKALAAFNDKADAVATLVRDTAKSLADQRAQLAAQSKETLARLKALDEKTTAHQMREASFNKRLRRITVLILSVVAISALMMVWAWKP